MHSLEVCATTTVGVSPSGFSGSHLSHSRQAAFASVVLNMLCRNGSLAQWGFRGPRFNPTMIRMSASLSGSPPPPLDGIARCTKINCSVPGGWVMSLISRLRKFVRREQPAPDLDDELQVRCWREGTLSSATPSRITPARSQSTKHLPAATFRAGVLWVGGLRLAMARANRFYRRS